MPWWLPGRHRALRQSLLLLAVALAFLPAQALAQAAQPRPVSLALNAPAETPLGETASLVALLKDGAGQPIPGARILFTSPASFGGTVGEMAIGEVVTDPQGTAKLDYQLSIQGPNRFFARFYGDALNQPAEASSDIQATGLAQLTRRQGGVPLPFLGWWVIVVVLWCVWSVYLVGMLQILSLAGAGGQRPSPAGGGERPLETGGQP